MRCTKNAERELVQGDLNEIVYDVEMTVATAGSVAGKGAGHPDNKEAFPGTHGASLNLIACSKPCKVRQHYVIEITDAPPEEAKPSPTS